MLQCTCMRGVVVAWPIHMPSTDGISPALHIGSCDHGTDCGGVPMPAALVRFFESFHQNSLVRSE